MKFQQISYFIHDDWSTEKRRLVHGYAVECDSPLRFCVRDGLDGWRIDHWETGFSIAGGVSTHCETLEAATYAAVGYLTLKREQVPGVLQKAREMLGSAYPLNPDPTA